MKFLQSWPTQWQYNIMQFVRHSMSLIQWGRIILADQQHDQYRTIERKKTGLDTTDVSSHRPISNLSVVSKLLEHIVARQLMAYLSTVNLLPTLQSWFPTGSFNWNHRSSSNVEAFTSRRSGWSGCANSPRLNGSLRQRRSQHFAAASAADFGIDGNVHRWFRSYLVGRTHYILHGAHRSLITRLLCRRDQFWNRICFANLILTLFLNSIILSSPHRGFEVALLPRPLKKILIDWLYHVFNQN